MYLDAKTKQFSKLMAKYFKQGKGNTYSKPVMVTNLLSLHALVAVYSLFRLYEQNWHSCSIFSLTFQVF